MKASGAKPERATFLHVDLLRDLPLGDPATIEFDWTDVIIVSHLERAEVVEYYNGDLKNLLVVLTLPTRGWGDATFAERTAVRMYHARACMDAARTGTTQPCLHDRGGPVLDTVRLAGDTQFIDSIIKEEAGGVFTYRVVLDDDEEQIVRCGHDLSGYPRSLRASVREFWKDMFTCPAVPHFLGDMALVFGP